MNPNKNDTSFVNRHLYNAIMEFDLQSAKPGFLNKGFQSKEFHVDKVGSLTSQKHTDFLPLYIQCLKIAIIFELIYT